SGNIPQDQSHRERHVSDVSGYRRVQSLAQDACGLAAILPERPSLLPTPDTLRAGGKSLGCSAPGASSAQPVHALFACLGAASRPSTGRTVRGREEQFPLSARTTLGLGYRFCPPRARLPP